MSTTLIAIFTLIALATPVHAESNSGPPQRTPLAALVVKPEQFDDSDVLVVAWGVIEFEGAALYLSASDHKYLVSESGVWLDVPNEPREGIQVPTTSGGFQGYMAVRGRFKARDPIRGFAGRITDITQLVLHAEPLLP